MTAFYGVSLDEARPPRGIRRRRLLAQAREAAIVGILVLAVGYALSGVMMRVLLNEKLLLALGLLP